MGPGPKTLLDRIERGGHELVVHAADPDTGLRTIIAIHSTVLGPALGGTRFHLYPTEDAALEDVLRLSAGMTMKAAAAGLDLGGGKAVIIGDPSTLASDALFGAYGRVVDSLGGRYITAEDVGTTVENMVAVSTETRFVTGLPIEAGGSGDPSPMTARGVRAAMRAVAAEVWEEPRLAGRRIAIQGTGKVGAELARLLAADGAELVVADVDEPAARTVADDTGATVVDADAILSTPCDVLAPCALGAVLSKRTIPALRCRAVVGSANNQLAGREDAVRLSSAGVLYAPDYVANAGGIVNISVELRPEGYSFAEAARRTDTIFDRMREILETAHRRGIDPLDAADHLASSRIRAARAARGGPDEAG